MDLISHVDSVRVIAFEAHARYGDEPCWLTLSVSQRWSAIEDALE
jgi:hypothetical protein